MENKNKLILAIGFAVPLIVIFTSFIITDFSDDLFAFGQNETTTNKPNDILYSAKFVCGSIYGSEGPLRPGHYDTDINIINRQINEVKFLWNVVVNDGQSSHSVLKGLGNEEATGISCKQIKEILGTDESDTKLLEGFVLIRIPLDYVPSSTNTSIVKQSNENIDLLDVQVFYTANALETLPHEVLFENISFYIIQDYTGKVPSEMFRTHLDITLDSVPNELANTELKIKQVLGKEFNIPQSDFDKIVIRIKDVSLGVGTLLDDHAVSLQIVEPKLVP